MGEPTMTQPAMSHSPAYYQQYRSSHITSPNTYQQPYHVQRPPPAQVAGRSERPLHGSDHVKKSISSATSGSTDATETKQHAPAPAFHHALDAERGYMQERVPGRSHMSPPVPPRVSRTSNGHTGSREMVQSPPATVIRYIHHDDGEDEKEEPDHAIWILFWMSLLDPFYSAFSCAFTIITLLVLVAISPIRLCQPEWSFSTTLIRTVCPIYRKHLQLLYAESVESAHNFEFGTLSLILVNVFAPLLSICMAFFSWIAAVFWLFAIAMGNPDGTEKRDDGRATVLMARNKWEKYLLLALHRR